MANGQKKGTATQVAVKTNVGTKVFVAFAVGLGLGLAAYGYGFGFVPGIKPIIPVTQPSVNQNAPVSTLSNASQCNVAPVSTGGYGRCYPGCTADADCSDADVSAQVGAYVSTYSVCKEKAVALCGASAACVKSVCGDEKVVCRQGPNGGICSRPNFNLTQAQCAATAPGYGSAAPNGTLAGAGNISACSQTGGKCYRSCKENVDCVPPADQQIYEACIKAAIPACTTTSTGAMLAAPSVNQNCLAQRCPKPKAGTCLKDAAGAPSHCAEPTAATTALDCSKPAGATLAAAPGGTVWVGTCIVNGKTCSSDADCPARKIVPGFWLGMCPSQTGGQANCTPGILTLCKRPEPPPTTCVRTPPKDGGPARCSRACISDKDCPAPDVQKCQEFVKQNCTDAAGVLNQDCYDKNIKLCPTTNSCIMDVAGRPGHCSNATGASTEVDCATSGGGGDWVGTCGTTDRQCKTDRDCQPGQPTQPGSTDTRPPTSTPTTPTPSSTTSTTWNPIPDMPNTVPIITKQPLSTNTLANIDQDLMKFQVSVAGAPVSWKQMVFQISKTSNLWMGNFRLRRGATDLNLSDYSVSFVSGGTATNLMFGSITTGTNTGLIVVSFGNGQEEWITGSGNVYTLHASIGGAIAGQSIKMSFYRDPANSKATGYIVNNAALGTFPASAQIWHLDTAASPSGVASRMGALLWSDVSAIPHSANTEMSRDWRNDAFISSLPGSEGLSL